MRSESAKNKNLIEIKRNDKGVPLNFDFKL